jgi:hypothetical protein
MNDIDQPKATERTTMLHMDRHDGHPSQLQSKAKLPERTQQDTELPNLVMDDPIGATLKANLMQS